jgi:hypothetical protein
MHHTREVVRALDFRSFTDTTTNAVVAILGLVGVFLIIVGLWRAVVGRLRPQVVIEDMTVPKKTPNRLIAGLSVQLREAVRDELIDSTQKASHSVINTIGKDAKGRLIKISGSLRIKDPTTGLRQATESSLSTLAAGIGAVAPKDPQGLVAIVAAALPGQRGWRVKTIPTSRGSGANSEVGMTIEVGRLGAPPDEVTTFWATSAALRAAASEVDKAVASNAILLRLITPAARWIAIRLVSRQLGGRRTRGIFGRKTKRELRGLQKQLAGQMSLYATNELREFDEGFAKQALMDLAEAASLLAKYYRPLFASAAVHEALGYSHLRAGVPEAARTEFIRGVRSNEKSKTLLLAMTKEESPEHKDSLGNVQVRLTKCRVLSGDPGEQYIAHTELKELEALTSTGYLALYNNACLFAIASDALAVSAADREALRLTAWRFLGRALLVQGANAPWMISRGDDELGPLPLAQRDVFLAELKRGNPSMSPVTGARAEEIVSQALQAVENFRQTLRQAPIPVRVRRWCQGRARAPWVPNFPQPLRRTAPGGRPSGAP